MRSLKLRISQCLAHFPFGTEEVRIANLKLVTDHSADKLTHL